MMAALVAAEVSLLPVPAAAPAAGVAAAAAPAAGVAAAAPAAGAAAAPAAPVAPPPPAALAAHVAAAAFASASFRLGIVITCLAKLFKSSSLIVSVNWVGPVISGVVTKVLA